ncbi:hypothetical protein B0T24DRAFT_189906 [Lasiosphaeria ovina]|uniref:Secreted protein n=1 Tax=Lasiosphaeria ovina TaxID=92902 RepID=A0AAE0TUL2_9PEZI|nr:hypothetical protein B0T24DRAFT_189906 [Lasiosphaeria ovina]
MQLLRCLCKSCWCGLAVLLRTGRSVEELGVAPLSTSGVVKCQSGQELYAPRCHGRCPPQPASCLLGVALPVSSRRGGLDPLPRDGVLDSYSLPWREGSQYAPSVYLSGFILVPENRQKGCGIDRD